MNPTQSGNRPVGNSSRSISCRQGDDGVNVKVEAKWNNQTKKFDVKVAIRITKEAVKQLGYSEDEGWEIYYGSNEWSKPVEIEHTFSEDSMEVKESMKELSEAKKCMKKAAEDYDGKVERNETETTKVSKTLQSALGDAKSRKSMKEKIEKVKSKIKESVPGKKDHVGNKNPEEAKKKEEAKKQEEAAKKTELCDRLLQCIERYEKAYAEAPDIIRKAKTKIEADYIKRTSVELSVGSVYASEPKNVAFKRGKIKVSE